MDPQRQYLIFPLIVTLVGGLVAALLAGLVLYLVNRRQQSSVVKQALLSEITFLIKQAHDYDHYLDRPNHYWLQENHVLKESPVFVASKTDIFNACLPLLYLLSPSEVERIFQFYSHFTGCERLIEILFGRIAKQEL